MAELDKRRYTVEMAKMNAANNGEANLFGS